MPISPFVPVMDKMQGPHPTHGSTHVCSFSPPSASELSPQYLATPYHSSQALLWNNYKKPPQDSIQDTLWSPQWTEPQIPSSPPDFWNTLQLNHTSVDNLPLAASSVVSVDSPDNAVLGVDSALRLSDGGRTVKPESFPLSVVSGPRPIPFACRLDMATAAKSREVSFAKISAYNKDLERNSRGKDGVPVSVKVEMDDSPKLASQGNGSSLHSVREREREERGSESMEMLVQKDMQKQGDEFGGTIASSLGDSTIVLKLGKRTYLEHSSAGVEGNHRAVGASIAKNPKSNGTNNNGNSNGGTIKRHKALSPTVNIPRCQAEDCNADLSDAKGYHRRHKVCEWHSKSSKVKVASIEQRFCQQCSRFHVLSEFDEGKRSCRRRLAGHNERRRKQQPEPMSLLSAANYAHFAGGKHLLSTSLLDHFYFLQHKRASMFSCLDSGALTGHPGVVEADLQGLKLQHHPKQKPVTNLPAAELHHFMWGSRERDGNLVGRGAQALTVANDHGLEQSNPGGPSTTSAACLIPVPHQPPPEVSVSRRALSLLSSSFGSPNNSCSMSMSLGVSLPSIEGLLTENHCATASCLTMSSSSSCFMSNSGKGMEIMPLLQTHGITTLASPDKGAVIHSSSMDHVQPSTIPNFDGSSMFLMVPENGFQGSQYSRPVLDLMQVSSSEPQQQQQQVEIQFTDLEGLSMFGRHSMM